jgi:hypothetical protein
METCMSVTPNLIQSAREIKTALDTSEATNLSAMRDTARAIAEIAHSFVANGVADQGVMDEAMGALTSIHQGQRALLSAHNRLAAFGRKLGIQETQWGDCVPYGAKIPLNIVEAA